MVGKTFSTQLKVRREVSPSLQLLQVCDAI